MRRKAILDGFPVGVGILYVHLCNGRIDRIERIELDHSYAKAKISVAGECEHGSNGKSGDSTTTTTTTMVYRGIYRLNRLYATPPFECPPLLQSSFLIAPSFTDIIYFIYYPLRRGFLVLCTVCTVCTVM